MNTSSSTSLHPSSPLPFSLSWSFLSPFHLLTSKAVSREKLEMFEELARIFSEDNNAVAQRELLVRSNPTQILDGNAVYIIKVGREMTG